MLQQFHFWKAFCIAEFLMALPVMFYSLRKKYVVNDILNKLSPLKSNKRLLDRSLLAPDSDDWKHKPVEKGFVHALIVRFMAAGI